MKQALTEIYNRKKKTIKTLLKNNNELVAVVYKGLAKNQNIRDIHREIKKVYQSQPIHDVKVYKYCVKLAKKGKKQVENDVNAILLASEFTEKPLKTELYAQCSWKYMHKREVFTTTKRYTYEVAQKQEATEKEQLLKDSLKGDMVFVISSVHNDVAIDHSKWQGKIFYNAEWRKHIFDDELTKKVAKYISSHQLKSIQWVTNKPVWLITRPNCRHYFKKLSVEEVLNTSVKDLIKKHDMSSQVGKKNTQTIKHPLNRDWYTKENIDGIIDKYIDRLEFHRMMYKQAPTEELRRWIEKDMQLITKWKNYQRRLYHLN